MNTRLGKSFGLAFVVAVGILAVMFALGTFNAPKAGADVNDGTGDAKTVTTTPDAPGPGAAIGMELGFELSRDAVSFDEITISLEDFGVPASISERSISVRQGADGNAAAAVDVDGTNIIVELPDIDGEVAGLGIGANSTITIVIRKNAGITAPTAAGEYMVTVAHNDQDPAVELGVVTISRTLTTDPAKGASGTDVTVSGKAFADGTGTLSSQPVGGGDSSDLKDVTVKDGAFETTVVAKDLKKAAIDGRSLITFRDSNGETASAEFKVTGTTTLGSDSVGKGKSLEISIADWIQAMPHMVKIDGVALTIEDENGDPETVALDEDNAATFYVYVAAAVGLGTKTVVLFDVANERLDSASVEVTALALNVSPSTVVAGQEITVEGSGFSTATDNQLATLNVGGVDQMLLSNRNSVADYDVLSNGRIVITFDVPDGVTDGSKTIRVTDDAGRVGEVALMVREPTITLNPITSRRATTVSVSGTGFPANENITVDYGTDETGIASGRTDNTGNFSASFVVPSDADIGGEVEVKASVSSGGEDYEAKATHTVPDKAITVSPEVARSGDTVEIVGTGFPRYADVQVKIGDGPFRATTARTDNVGDFNVSVIIPGIDSGTHVIQVDAGGSIATWVITVPDAAVITTRPSADVFADLITSNNLTVVWHFDNGTKAWSFYDPRPAVAAAVDLNEVTSGDNVWIQVVADQMFQGEMLTAGWNLVTLN